MRRDRLEKHIGKFVTVTLWDGEMISGYLYRTDSERYKNNPTLYLRKKHYVLEDKNTGETSILFMCSYVSKLGYDERNNDWNFLICWKAVYGVDVVPHDAKFKDICRSGSLQKINTKMNGLPADHAVYRSEKMQK